MISITPEAFLQLNFCVILRVKYESADSLTILSGFN